MIRPPDPAAMLRDGAARHAAGDLDGAERAYRAVLAQDRDDPNAHNLLGVLARQRGDLATALRHTEHALSLRPDAPVFLANRGAALAEAGRLPEAVASLRAALARRPQDPTALRNLGQALSAMGLAAAAVAPLRAAAALLPDAPEPHLALAHALRESGDTPAAAVAAQAALARATAAAPALAEQARFLLAGLGHGPAPDRAPPAYVRDLFDGFAARFDAELAALDYRTPALLADALRAAGVPADRTLRVLDLGCGTGLSGAALAPFAAHLTGLDLSPRMLDAARRTAHYDALHEADLLDWLPRHPARFDLIAAADVLNYLGDLAPALRAIAAALAPGAPAAFSIEAADGAPYALHDALRYRHDPDHVEALAHDAGFTPIARDPATLRRERGAPVAGVLFVLRRR